LTQKIIRERFAGDELVDMIQLTRGSYGLLFDSGKIIAVNAAHALDQAECMNELQYIQQQIARTHRVVDWMSDPNKLIGRTVTVHLKAEVNPPPEMTDPQQAWFHDQDIEAEGVMGNALEQGFPVFDPGWDMTVASQEERDERRARALDTKVIVDAELKEETDDVPAT
jgi:hypothetical protein